MQSTVGVTERSEQQTRDLQLDAGIYSIQRPPYRCHMPGCYQHVLMHTNDQPQHACNTHTYPCTPALHCTHTCHLPQQVCSTHMPSSLSSTTCTRCLGPLLQQGRYGFSQAWTTCYGGRHSKASCRRGEHLGRYPACCGTARCQIRSGAHRTIGMSAHAIHACIVLQQLYAACATDSAMRGEGRTGVLTAMWQRPLTLTSSSPPAPFCHP